ncbi:MAG: hypothetical protein ACREVX_03695 [Clostridium sp.]|uniref:hypothetical protein n=1 Tax=Clostridium sp. TaxID=1506 RepID=UPI003D6D05BB
MYENRRIKWVLEGLVLIMIILTLKFTFLNNVFIQNKKQIINKNPKTDNFVRVEKYGYSDILECLQKNKNFVVKSINEMQDEICNVEVIYDGDMKLLQFSLFKLNESGNLLNINKITVDKDAKITNISINFKKNK